MTPTTSIHEASPGVSNALPNIIACDNINFDTFWLKDKCLDDPRNLPSPDVIAADIVDNLEAALEQFQAVAEELG